MPRERGPSRIANAIRDVFKERGITHAGEVTESLVRQEIPIKYYTMSRLFYCLREIGLIEFVGEKDSDKLLKYRLHRIVPGKEYDPRWDVYPLHELYPSTHIGGASYREGTAEGRAQEYAKED